MGLLQDDVEMVGHYGQREDSIAARSGRFGYEGRDVSAQLGRQQPFASLQASGNVDTRAWRVNTMGS
jgi:hypothetical protein